MSSPQSVFPFRSPVVPAELVWLEGYGNYTTLHLANGQKMLSCRNLLQFEEWLCGSIDFVRIHKLFVVNRAFVRGFRKEDKTWFAELLCGRRLPVARGRVGVANTKLVN